MGRTEQVHDARLQDFLLGAFGVSWLLWIPAGLDARGEIDLPLPATVLVVLGALGPMLAALAAAARHGGRHEVVALLRRLRFRGVARRWFVLALVFGAVTALPAVAYVVVGGAADGPAVMSHLAVLPLHFLLVATVGGGLDEELGWRGIAQPQLQQHLRPVPANLLLGVAWAVWHLPLWLDPASAQAAYPFALYVLIIVGHSLVTGYLYNASGGSLLIAVLVHSAHNTFDGLRYAVLGDDRGALTWQLVLAVVSLGLGVALCVSTRGRLGFAAVHSARSDIPPQVGRPDGSTSPAHATAPRTESLP